MQQKCVLRLPQFMFIFPLEAFGLKLNLSARFSERQRNFSCGFIYLISGAVDYQSHDFVAFDLVSTFVSL